MFVKVHRRVSQGYERTVVALCDAKLLGKKFRSANFVLDLQAYRAFYDGERVTESQAVELLKNSGNANIVGPKSIKAAEKAFNTKLVIKKIAGIPHTQVYRV
ncbi:MAG: DUF424 domain-containing protein [Candidatus Micrarchaeota archaeon]